MRKTLGCIRKADTDFNMINDGEHICVALSGGKDSMLLLKALKNYTYFSKNKFKLTAISIDVGFENTNYKKMEHFCKEVDVPLEVERTNIKEVVFDERKESNPCSLCSKMKKGALNDLALRLGSNKIAYGHHRDDFIESFFLSLFYEGRFHTFKPVTFLDRKKVTSIRPLIYLKEKEIIKKIEKTDKYRSEYYKYYTGREWNDARNYDFCLDTTSMSYEKLVRVVKAYIDICRN